MLPQIRTVIADDHSIFRQGLAFILNRQPQITVINQASNGKELVSQVEKQNPDVVITDIRMPEMSGIEATAIITEKYPNTNVIALSMYDKKGLIKEMLQAGAKGFLVKNSDESEIVRAITAVHKNGAYYCNSTISSLLHSTTLHTDLENKEAYFTDKEIAVIRLICQQYSNKEIAVELDATIRSVESARERIQHKIGAKNMVGIAIYAIEHEIYV